MVALVGHAKAVVRSRDGTGQLSPENSTFKYVHALRFEGVRRFLGIRRRPEIGTSVASWFEHLRKAAVHSVDLLIQSRTNWPADHIAVAFSGGGGWVIRTVSPRSTSLWIANWSPDHRGDPTNRIWSVSYREVPVSRVELPRVAVTTAAADVARALSEARDFAHQTELTIWEEWFNGAILKLKAEPVTYEYHPDMLPSSGYGLAARQLLSACEKAWVFGGMGSWNDVGGFSDRQVVDRHESITRELYRAVTVGIAAAVNSFAEE